MPFLAGFLRRSGVVRSSTAIAFDTIGGLPYFLKRSYFAYYFSQTLLLNPQCYYPAANSTIPSPK